MDIEKKHETTKKREKYNEKTRTLNDQCVARRRKKKKDNYMQYARHKKKRNETLNNYNCDDLHPT